MVVGQVPDAAVVPVLVVGVERLAGVLAGSLRSGRAVLPMTRRFLLFKLDDIFNEQYDGSLVVARDLDVVARQRT